MIHSAGGMTRSPLDRFRAAIEDCKKVIEVLDRDCAFHRERNGRGETFRIERFHTHVHGQPKPSANGWFEFSKKTAHKHPDVAVCACLIVFHHHFATEYRIRADGKDDDGTWIAARECCQRILGYGAGFSLKTPPRMTIHGLGFTSNWMKARGGGSVRDLSNGWDLRRDTKATFKYTVYPERSGEDHANPLLAGNTVRVARWNATVAFFQTEFRVTPFLDEFVNAMRITPGEWAPFLAWSDKLQDHGHDAFAQKVRAHLPR